MTQKSVEAVKPAWKNKWFWLVAGLPLVVVVASFVTLYLAISSSDGVVDDNYYKEGLAVNQDLRRDDKAREYQMVGQLSFNNDVIEFHLQSVNANLNGQPLKLLLQNMAVSAQDQTLTLVPTAQAGVWQTRLEKMPPKGLWQVRVEGHDWRLNARVKGDLAQGVSFSSL